MLRRLIVSGADFRETTGIISIIEITENEIELLREIKIEHPFPKPSEKGKVSRCRHKLEHLPTQYMKMNMSI